MMSRHIKRVIKKRFAGALSPLSVDDKLRIYVDKIMELGDCLDEVIFELSGGLLKIDVELAMQPSLRKQPIRSNNHMSCSLGIIFTWGEDPYSIGEIMSCDISIDGVRFMYGGTNNHNFDEKVTEIDTFSNKFEEVLKRPLIRQFIQSQIKIAHADKKMYDKRKAKQNDVTSIN